MALASGMYEGICVRDLWDGFSPLGFDKGIFMIFRGYMDESYSGDLVPKMFNITCTYAEGKEWPWIEMAWQKCLEEKNAELTRQGRKPIRRYHSADISNYAEDFEGWNGPERDEFCAKLVRVLGRHTLGYEGYAINLQDVVAVWPELQMDRIELAYLVLVMFIILQLGVQFDEEMPGSKITLFHDRCEYDHVYLEAFNKLVLDPNFRHRDCFTTIAPMGWEECIPLQPADLMAYENFKEGLRQLPGEKPRNRRIILNEILSMSDGGAHLRLMDRSMILKIKGIFNGIQGIQEV